MRGELKESRSALEERDRESRHELESRLEETREEVSRLGARLADGQEEQLRADLEATNARLASLTGLVAESDDRDALRARLEETRTHIAALERSGIGAVGAGPKWREVQTFPGLKGSRVVRYRFDRRLVPAPPAGGRS